MSLFEDSKENTFTTDKHGFKEDKNKIESVHIRLHLHLSVVKICFPRSSLISKQALKVNNFADRFEIVGEIINIKRIVGNRIETTTIH